jgi:nitrate/TMAO reductase-like tetraheme cytochrome c subunit
VKKGLVLAVLASFVFLTLGIVIFHVSNAFAQAQATYIGVDKCKGCHPTEFKDFTNTKFSKSWTILQMRGKTADGECLKCHSTGYGKPSGFVSEEATPNLKGKQCESCHGPGSIHSSNPSDAAATATMKQYIKENDVCIQCHICMKTHKSVDY